MSATSTSTTTVNNSINDAKEGSCSATMSARPKRAAAAKAMTQMKPAVRVKKTKPDEKLAASPPAAKRRRIAAASFVPVPVPGLVAKPVEKKHAAPAVDEAEDSEATESDDDRKEARPRPQPQQQRRTARQEEEDEEKNQGDDDEDEVIKKIDSDLLPSTVSKAFEACSRAEHGLANYKKMLKERQTRKTALIKKLGIQKKLAGLLKQFKEEKDDREVKGVSVHADGVEFQLTKTPGRPNPMDRDYLIGYVSRRFNGDAAPPKLDKPDLIEAFVDDMMSEDNRGYKTARVSMKVVMSKE